MTPRKPAQRQRGIARLKKMIEAAARTAWRFKLKDLALHLESCVVQAREAT